MGMYDGEPGAFGQSSATLTIAANARLTLLTGAADTGTGSYTVLQQVVAEELQVPLGSVTVVQGDTATAIFEVGAGGSRLTHTGGQAAIMVARELRQALLPLAAKPLAGDQGQVEMRQGRFVLGGGWMDETAAP